jgi:CheY-like chemotaxis protein
LLSTGGGAAPAQATMASSTEEVDPTAVRGDGGMLLIVEDDAGIREALAELLEDEGYGVAIARDGDDAFRKLSAGLRPRAIVLDLMMPVMDGWAFRRAQLGAPELRDIPVVVVTASQEGVGSFDSLLALAVLPKPVTPPALLIVLARLWATP